MEEPVIYLQEADFNDKGLLDNPYFKDKKVVILLQANYCGYCTEVKPMFQKAADIFKKRTDEPKVVFATIQADGEEKGESELSPKLTMMKPDFVGFPDFLKFYKNSWLRDEVPERTVSSIIEYALR